MSKLKFSYQCQSCGFESFKWLGKCSKCGDWNSFVEVETLKTIKSKNRATKAISLKDIKLEKNIKYKTGVDEIDRVFGNGITKGSLSLLSGEPGIGKSTFLLKIADLLKKSSNLKTLYISGEETLSQVAQRAKRLCVDLNNTYCISETCWDEIKEEIKASEAEFIILDSIQTTVSGQLAGSAGSISQIKEVTFELMNLVKSKNKTAIIVGHINKEGGIAGPKVLEHMVDTVLFFEGEKYCSKKILRVNKNRYGSANEIGLFVMTEHGLGEYVQNYKRNDKFQSGTVLTCVNSGSRNYILEIQALVKDSINGTPRFVCHGVTQSRVQMILAVLEKFLKVKINFCDIYISVSGNMKIEDCDSDIGIALALVSSLKSKNVSSQKVYFGELGLDGNIKQKKSYKEKSSEIEKFKLRPVFMSGIKQILAELEI